MLFFHPCCFSSPCFRWWTAALKTRTVTQQREERKRRNSSKQTVLVSENMAFPVEHVGFKSGEEGGHHSTVSRVESTMEKMGEGKRNSSAVSSASQWRIAAEMEVQEQKWGQWDWLSVFVCQGICTIFFFPFSISFHCVMTVRHYRLKLQLCLSQQWFQALNRCFGQNALFCLVSICQLF